MLPGSGSPPNLLPVWRGRTHQAQLSVKLHQASPEGGRLAPQKTVDRHQPAECQVNSLTRVEGLVGESPVRFLLDSGVAVSVVRYETLDDAGRRGMVETGCHTPTSVGADGFRSWGKRLLQYL